MKIIGRLAAILGVSFIIAALEKIGSAISSVLHGDTVDEPELIPISENEKIPEILITNISERYEEMCLKNPLKYKNHPMLAQVINDYRKLMNGEITDKEGRHVPSETINGQLNPDYARYLRLQKKLTGASWIDKELRRFSVEKTEEQIRAEYFQTLIDLGLSVELTAYALTDDKINSYTPEDWKNLVEALKGYEEKYDILTIKNFLLLIRDKEVLISPASMDRFNALTEHEVPPFLTVELTRGRITMEQAEEIIRVKAERGASWEVATSYVLQVHAEAVEADKLRRGYEAQLRKG